MRSFPHRTRVLLAFLLVVTASPALALERSYRVQTSTPEGLAVCAIEGAVQGAQPGDQLEVALTPASGQEAFLGLRFLDGPSGVTAAGVETACDMFDPDLPTGTLSLPVPTGSSIASFWGVLYVHAHPDGNCGASDRGQGTIGMVVTEGGAAVGDPRFKITKCDADEAGANLRLHVQSPPGGVVGVPALTQVHIQNHGLGTAQDATLTTRGLKNALVDSVVPTQGTCERLSNGEIRCDLGDVPAGQVPRVDVTARPFHDGNFKVQYAVDAANLGGLFDGDVTVTTPIAQAATAQLNVEVDCRNGAAGTITINPDGGGGTKTCTCPHPQSGLDDFVCFFEIYASATSVTLTAAATTGQFDKWTKDCKGQPAACVLTVDPNVKTFYTTRGKFKP